MAIFRLFRKKEAFTSSFYYSPIPSDEIDTFLEDAGKIVIQEQKVSIGLLQRRLKIGFNRAARMLDQLNYVGVVGPEDGFKPRKILMSMEQFQYLIDNNLLTTEPQHSYLNNTLITDDISPKPFDEMNGREFELFCADLLKKNGFMDVNITSESGDFGIDIVATQNRVLYAIQCKCYSSDIGVDAVYQASGGMKYYQANVGVVFTNRFFTKQARELADKIGIVLWDREFLIELAKNSK